MKRRALERHLRRHGAECLREGSRHTVWSIGGADSERIAAVPRHSEIKPWTAQAIDPTANRCPLSAVLVDHPPARQVDLPRE